MSNDSSLHVGLDQARDAFQCVTDGVVFADADDVIVFANTAAARLGGAPVGTLEGSDGQQLLGAARERGVEVNAFPRHSLDGRDEGWTAILRGASDAEADDTNVQQEPVDHIDLIELVANMRLGDDLDGTIENICEAVAALPGIDGAMIILLPPSGDFMHKAHAGRARVAYKKDQRLPLRDPEVLIDMTLAGPWLVSSNSAAAWRMFGPLALAMRIGGIRATAYAGMRVGGRLLGVLSVASMQRNAMSILQSRLDLVAQAATVAATMINNQTTEFGRDAATRQRVRDCIDRERFRPVFQPIVRLADGEVVAYEALTRFDDGRAPDAHFREAHLVGLGRELEEAAARAALQACTALPGTDPIAVNFSPDVLVALAASELLQQPPRALVVEVTEHAVVEDYRRLRTALLAVPHIPLSVDDAGAGFASLRHILELQPEYVKLDMGLVRDVHRDPARAALVAGMCHFGRSAGKTLIAEGVENAEEAEALRALGVELAQGYHFAKPAPASSFC